MQSRCDYTVLQTPLAWLEQHNHTNNAPVTSKGSEGEAPLTFLAAKAVFMDVIFAMVM